MQNTSKYTAVCDLPAIPLEELKARREHIRKHGVLDHIHVDEKGQIIDGLVRKMIADDLGIPCPEKVHQGLSEEEKRALRRGLNLARRHLTNEQKRELVAAQLADTPRWSDRRIAQALGVSHPTVAVVRREMVATGKITSSVATEGLDGKTRRVREDEGESHDEAECQDEGESRDEPMEKELDLGTLGTLQIDPDGVVAKAEADAFRSISVVDRSRKLLVCRNWDARAREALSRGVAVLLLPEFEEGCRP